MKVLLLNGSPKKDGNTNLALEEIAAELQKNGVDSEIICIGAKAVQGCIACYKCKKTGICAFNDLLYQKVRQAVIECDAIIVGSPVYYAGPNGSLCALLDRLFLSCGSFMEYKPAASVAVCRRGGASATFDRLNKYFTINNMPIVSSQYWNSVHGMNPGEAAQDFEGLQIMRILAKNMVWLLNSIKGHTHPLSEERVATNFIR